MFADRLLVVDHSNGGRILLLCLCDSPSTASPQVDASSSYVSALRWMGRQVRSLRRLAAGLPPGGPSAASSAQPPTGKVQFISDSDRQRYLANIGDISEHLRNGDSYEVCLTTSFRCKRQPPPLDLYRHLRRTNPAPHAAYLRIDPYRLCGQHSEAHLSCADPATASGIPSRAHVDRLGPGGLAVCCSSPERFMSVDATKRVECKPIKGTARRGVTAADDAAIMAALQSGDKERAENLMIVDLIRNDLGRVCCPGSVQVTPTALTSHHNPYFGVQ